ncbi:plant UBX domain-containing protein 11 isoform X3 [Setaria viridis]|uniref:plant UBX domain-containing protein 11 isoform X3 n=1 Tax=Setaria viridis TaxID=4556 RepID=UPI0014934623|nr:plant UBX domain-containing protein 11 isoform X3 [Setaria viridis]
MWVFLGFVGREYKQVFWRLISYLEESFRVGVGRRGGLLPRRKATEGEIDPQKSVPSISVIGLNGVMLWNHEGHISSENLKESIEKAWGALHLQETAATLLTASLASRNAESVNTTTALPQQGGSSTSENPSVSSSAPDISGASGVADSAELVSQLPSSTNHDELIEIKEKKGKGSKSDSGDRSFEKLESASTEIECDLPVSSMGSNTGSSIDPKEDTTPSLKRKNKDDGSLAAVPMVAAPSTIISRGVSSQVLVEQDITTSSAPVEPVFNSAKSDDIQLSIRMPSGNRLEIELTKQDVLRKVKNFVDENKGSGLGSYDLSLVYPKRIFSEQDMETTLCELGIQNRHAMIVVPHRRPVQVSRLQSSSSSSPYHAGDSSGGGGYFGYLRTIMSYVNPLSYLGGNTTTSRQEQEPNEGPQQLGHRSGPWSERHPLPGNRGQETTDESSANMLRRRARPFGANVHTLGSEQGPSDDRNVFWNGNSTEFGGDDRK